MKLTAFLLWAVLFNASTKAVSQKISFSGKNVPIEKVFSSVEKQTGYFFLYHKRTLDKVKAITVKAENMPLIDFLNLILKGQPLKYTIIGNKTINIFPATSVSGLENAAPMSGLSDIRDAAPFLIKLKVTGDDSHPLGGASVVNKNTKASGSTDAEGLLSLKVNIGDVLDISFVGFERISHTIKDNTATVTVKMKIASNRLDEVVINTGYYTVTDKERTGSISKITAKEIGQQTIINPLTAMQGRMAGVNIIQNGGNAGTGFDVQIRGRNSLRQEGNEPLYIIDGVPYSTRSMSETEVSAPIIPMANVSPLNSINPNDIESIEVLKDADATAIYGSRGSNGVVLITTKKGVKDKTSISLQSTIAVNKIGNYMKLMNTEEYIKMRRQAYINDGLAIPANAFDVNGTWDQHRYTDWTKEFVGNKYVTQNHQFSISGGSGQTQYLFSTNYRRDGTVYIGDFGYNKTNFLLNLNHKTKDNRFELQANIQQGFQKNKLMSYDLIGKVILPPNAPELYMENGELNWENNTLDNPLASLNGHYATKVKDFIGQLSLLYRIRKNLSLGVKGGFTSSDLDEFKATPTTTVNPSYGYTSEFSGLMTSRGQRTSWIVEPQLNWTHRGAKGKWDALIGGTVEEREQLTFGVNASNFISNDFIMNVANAVNQRVYKDGEVLYHYMAVFGRVNYNYLDKYIINLTGRRDGSSRFGDNNRFANFGALGAAWLFSSESFFADLSWLSFGKLRASYGIAGSDLIGDYQYLNTLTIGTNKYDGMTNLIPARLYNPDFSWEKNRKLEFALEMELFNGRIAPSFAYYRNRSSNQLVGVPLPGTTGFSSVQSNLDATVENRGFEFTLYTLNIDRKHFKWSTNFNISLPKNRLVAFPNLAQSTYANQFAIGYPITIRKAYRYLGINQMTGLFEVEDVNKDGYYNMEDRKILIDHNATLFGGMQNNVRYKNWTMDFLFQFVKQIKYSPYYYSVLPGVNKNVAARFSDYFTEENKDAEYQKPSTGANSLASRAHQYYYTSDAASIDASFIRLKTVQLQYSFPEAWLNKLRLSAYLQAQNLLTITKYWGSDPETLGTFLPSMKSISFGFNLNF